MTYPKQIYWNYTRFTLEFIKISKKIFSLGRHILKSADKHPYHDDEDMSILKTGFLILSKSPSSKYKGNERIGFLVEEQGLQKYKGKCTRCHATPEASNTGTVKLNFLKTCTVAVILYGLCIFDIKDKIPCHNLHLIKPKRNIKIGETTCNLCRTL